MFFTRKFATTIDNKLEKAETKRDYNEEVFSEIAPRYDFITRALSFWQDARWKRDLLQSLPQDTNIARCLDIACGTGDIAIMLGNKYPNAEINGIDITENMLQLARDREHGDHVTFAYGDMNQLPEPDESIDILTGGYALRNAPDLTRAINEIARVLKVGGTAAFLDFSKPKSWFWQKCEYYLLKGWTGFWGIAFHGNHEVYSYIAESLALYPNRETLRLLFQEKGFDIVFSKLYFLGITQVLVVRKKQ